MRLKTAHQGALSRLERLILTRVTDIESWFRQAWMRIPAPMMSSVDLRHSGLKLAPVDTNLFPAGFNNLNPAFLPMCVQAIQSFMLTYAKPCSRVLLVPEAHTRNHYYVASLLTLKSMMTKAGLDVILGHWDQDVVLGDDVRVHKIERVDNRLRVDGIEPCLVVLNNDLSSGVPELFQGIEQPIYPPLNLGWVTRKKSDHFMQYTKVVNEFSSLIGCDPWLINPMMSVVDNLDFIERVGLEELAESVDALLQAIQKKYTQYQIKDAPFVVVKADNGTYGMGVMMVHHREDILKLNRKQRTKMAVGKGGQTIRRVLVQEGVYTFESMPDGSVAEPVVYMIGSHVVGGFYRAHQTKGMNDNLNAPGMHFEPLAFDTPCNIPCCEEGDASPANRFYVYGVIARLAALAAGREELAII
ncbi:MAG: glutamate--cysteine ligase [Gammaproteobacteria bacterium]|nr:glutamate--cysteine ligase [Gammaproteobacteria bacterium]